MSYYAGLVPGLRPYADALINLAAAYGLSPRVTSMRRTRGQQRKLYRRYLQGMSAYPAAPPGSSKHERGLAFDVVVYPRSALRGLGRIWERAGGRWGGRFRDPVHFEA